MKSVEKGGLSSSESLVEFKVYLMQKSCQTHAQYRIPVVSSTRDNQTTFRLKTFRIRNTTFPHLYMCIGHARRKVGIFLISLGVQPSLSTAPRPLFEKSIL